MKRFFTLFLFALVAFNAFGQSSLPTIQTLLFTLNSYTGTSFPAGMAIGFQNNNTDGSFNTDLTSDVTTNGTSAGNWNDEGANGISYLGSGSAQRGSFLLRVSSTGLTNVKVNWIVRDIAVDANVNYIELQWRSGSTGTWNDVIGDIYQQGTTTSGTSFSVTLPLGANELSDLRIRWIYYEIGSGSRDRLAIDDVSVTGTALTSPTLSVSSSSLSAFSTTVVGQNSTSQTFNLSGSNFTNASGNITVTAPNTDFQVSSDNNTFGATATIPFTGSALASTPVYVRFTPQSAGAKSGNITFSDPGGVTTLPIVSVSGTGAAVCTEPSGQPINLILTPSYTSISGAFTAEGSADGYLVVRSTSATLSANPIDGTTYAAGEALGGGVVVSATAATTMNATGLTANTQYYFFVFSYKNTSCANINYLTSSPLTANTTTLQVLNVGDITIIGFRSDANDGLAFVPWVNLPNGTEIKFTDNAYTGTSFNTNENTLTWTNTSGTIAAGTVIKIGGPSNSNGSGANVGATSGVLDGLANGGDNIFVYQGSSPAENLIFGITFTYPWLISPEPVTSNSSYLPAVLNVTGGNIAITSTLDNMQFDPSQRIGSMATQKNKALNPTNWIGNDDGTVFGDFDLTVLPIELTHFSAKSENNQSILSWQTTSEKDNAFFGIEHATNGNDFREIAQVKGNGTTTQLADYQYIHTTPSVGANYYRLRQVDFNGTTTHSPIRSVWVSNKGKISLFPTVSPHEITLRTDDTETTQTYEIYNMLGERVLFGEIQGQKTILISELSRGVYIVKINGENLKFIKE